ncbi:hypothetical protein N2152v2_011160 [Parachlorella kessleri]
MARTLAFCLLLCLTALGFTARAQQLEVQHWFPEHPTTEFFSGKSVPCVIGVRNAGGTLVNITAAQASLNSPYNASMSLYNFTTQPYFLPLPAGQEASLEYNVFMPRQLPPREFNLKIQLYYTVEGPMLVNLFFNQTINIIEEPTWFDLELLGLWLVGFALLGIAAWFAAEYLKGLSFVKKAAKKSKKAQARDAAAPVDKEEWLRGTYYDQQKKKTVVKVTKKAE